MCVYVCVCKCVKKKLRQVNLYEKMFSLAGYDGLYLWLVSCVSRKTNLQRVVLVTMGCSIEILEAAGDVEAESSESATEKRERKRMEFCVACKRMSVLALSLDGPHFTGSFVSY